MTEKITKLRDTLAGVIFQYEGDPSARMPEDATPDQTLSLIVQKMEKYEGGSSRGGINGLIRSCGLSAAEHAIMLLIEYELAESTHGILEAKWTPRALKILNQDASQ